MLTDFVSAKLTPAHHAQSAVTSWSSLKHTKPAPASVHLLFPLPHTLPLAGSLPCLLWSLLKCYLITEDPLVYPIQHSTLCSFLSCFFQFFLVLDGTDLLCFLSVSLIRDAGEVTALSSEPRTMVGSGFVPCNYRRSESLWHLDLNKFQQIIIGQDKKRIIIVIQHFSMSWLL